MTPTDDVFGSGRDFHEQWNEELWDQMGRRAVAAAQIAPGARVLDMCCGAGSSAIPAAAAAGPTGTVDAVDLSAGLLEAARERAERAGICSIRWHHQDADHWNGSGYDALICCFGVFFFPDMDRTARHLIRSLRTGGRVVITTWASTAMHEFVPTMFEVIRKFDPTVTEPTSRGPAARIDSVTKTKHWLNSIGLEQVDGHDLPLQVRLTSDSAWALVAGSGFRALLPPDERLWPQIADELWGQLEQRESTTITLDAVLGTGLRPRHA
ncbi:MAG: class I SAM-dependent methyltransferase [Nakamurella sp.]